MKVTIKSLQLPEDVSFSQVEKYMSRISAERQAQIRRFRQEEDKLLSLFAELLMRKEIRQQLEISDDEIVFGKEPKGKPFLKGQPQYHFSLSHSGRCIVFVSDDKPIGIDVERIRPFHQRLVHKHFTDNEIEFIEKSENQELAFAVVWTRKEAFLKRTGEGISGGLRSVDVLKKSKEIYFYTKRLANDYIVSLCVGRCENLC